ncbi:hypothetical protein ACS0TY_005337 [Phlomoides rotata]
MERPIALKPLSIRDENSTIHRKKATADSKSKTSKQGAKNGGFSLKSRKALNDITNKSSIHTEASSQKKKSDNKKCNIVGDGHSHHHAFEGEPRLKKKVSANEKPDIAEEGFLHDHNKCIDAHKAALEISFYDTVFPGHDSSDQIVEEAKGDPDLELEEISMSEFSDWFKPRSTSPPSSPIHHRDSPFAWEIQPLELVLKQDERDLVEM